MWSSAKDWSAGMMALVVGSLNLMALPRVHILDNILLVDPLPTELRLRLSRSTTALPGSCSLHPQLSPTNSHTCSPKGPEATCSRSFRAPERTQGSSGGVLALVDFCSLCCHFWL